MLANHAHYPKIYPLITAERIRSELGIDIINDDLSQRAGPSKDLSEIYWLENIEYDKSKKFITKTLDAIDPDLMIKSVSLRFDDLKRFYNELKAFFGP